MHKKSQNTRICEKYSYFAKALHPRWVVFFLFLHPRWVLFNWFFAPHTPAFRELAAAHVIQISGWVPPPPWMIQGEVSALKITIDFPMIARVLDYVMLVSYYLHQN